VDRKAKDKTTWRNVIKTWWEENLTILNNLRTNGNENTRIVL
jgi:hypothetical protein